MSELLAQTELTPWQRQQLQADMTFFHDALGGCERILKTPIPLSYTRCGVVVCVCARVCHCAQVRATAPR